MKNVIIYTSDSCQFCHMAKDFLKEHNVEYTEKNISQDKEAMLELREKGFTGVPLIMVDDETIYGFDQDKLEKALDL
ncbi:MAG: glutaredoxin family protein [Tissierellia bacterium]|nr:glutaredoxin family protein [Tissierellia bacterium]